MADRILKFFGLRRVYVCEWGEFNARYDAIDRHMGRPIHKDMSVAPPWAKTMIVREPTNG